MDPVCVVARLGLSFRGCISAEPQKLKICLFIDRPKRTNRRSFPRTRGTITESWRMSRSFFWNIADKVVLQFSGHLRAMINLIARGSDSLSESATTFPRTCHNSVCNIPATCVFKVFTFSSRYYAWTENDQAPSLPIVSSFI